MIMNSNVIKDHYTIFLGEKKSNMNLLLHRWYTSSICVSFKKHAVQCLCVILITYFVQMYRNILLLKPFSPFDIMLFLFIATLMDVQGFLFESTL